MSGRSTAGQTAGEVAHTQLDEIPDSASNDESGSDGSAHLDELITVGCTQTERKVSARIVAEN